MIAMFKEQDLDKKLTKRKPISFMVNGKKLMLKEIAEISDMALETIKSRFIKNNDITLMELIATPTCRSELTKVVKWKGKYRNYKDISRMEDIPYGTLIGRLRTGRSLEEVINFKPRKRPKRSFTQKRREVKHIVVDDKEMYQERNLVNSLLAQGLTENEVKTELMKRIRL